MKLLILSDIHGNWAGLTSVLQAEGDADEILCLDDLVNYGPEPAACVVWAMQTRGKSTFRPLQMSKAWSRSSNRRNCTGKIGDARPVGTTPIVAKHEVPGKASRERTARMVGRS
jgi:hypothetical protein